MIQDNNRSRVHLGVPGTSIVSAGMYPAPRLLTSFIRRRIGDFGEGKPPFPNRNGAMSVPGKADVDGDQGAPLFKVGFHPYQSGL